MFGFEESYGYLAGTFVRDKDAARALAYCGVRCYYAQKGMTIYEALMSLYKKYGYYVEKVVSLTLKGIEGIAKIKGAVKKLREEYPAAVQDFKVLAVTDLMTGNKHDMVSLEDSPVNFPSADVLIFELDGGKMILRPSGTEPKLKAYCFTKGANVNEAKEKLNRLVNATDALMRELTK